MNINRFTIHCLLAISVMLSANAMGADPMTSPLEAMGWAVGGKWVEQLKTPDGGVLDVETTFTWAGHKKALKYEVALKANGKSRIQYEGMYYYHPLKKQLAMLQVDGAGNVVESIVTIEGKNIKQSNTSSSIDGKTQQQRVTIELVGDDAFVMKAMVPKGEEWVEAARFHYKRVRSAKEPGATLKK